MNATIERKELGQYLALMIPASLASAAGWTMVDTSTNDARNDIDEQAEREGLAIRRHRRMTAKHRRIVYRHAGIADPRP